VLSLAPSRVPQTAGKKRWATPPLLLIHTLQGPQNGSVRRWVRLQSPDYDRPKFQPLGGDVEVHDRTLIQLSSELAKKLQIASRLGDRGKGGPEVPGLLSAIQDAEGVGLQVPYLIEKIVRPCCIFDFPSL
jgi:hypothetical protein